MYKRLFVYFFIMGATVSLKARHTELAPYGSLPSKAQLNWHDKEMYAVVFACVQLRQL